jgi:hypothetical protein
MEAVAYRLADRSTGDRTTPDDIAGTMRLSREARSIIAPQV